MGSKAGLLGGADKVNGQMEVRRFPEVYSPNFLPQLGYRTLALMLVVRRGAAEIAC